MKPLRFLLVLFLSSAGAAADHVPRGLLYVAHFDHYAAASWARGARTPTLPWRHYRLTEGRFGRALALSRRDVFVVVGDDGDFHPARGAVEMWIRPNWNGDDGQTHSLLNIQAGPKNYLNVNKLPNNRLGAATGSAGAGRYQRIDADVSNWEAGQWHHVAVTWGDGKLAFFLDGRLVGEKSGAIPPSRAPAEIRVGSRFDGAIDELAIWSVRKTKFDLSAPVPAPEGPEPKPRPIAPPPVGKLDQYHFPLPAAAAGYVVAPKYFDDEVDPSAPPHVPAQPALNVTAAAGEYRSVGFVVYSTAALRALRITTTPLRSADGGAIPAANVAVFMNRRVLQRKAPRTPASEVVPVAALLDPFRPFDLPKGYFKEITVTVHAPGDARPGMYRGAVKIDAAGGRPTTLPLSVRVLPFRLQRSKRKQFGVYYQLDLDEAVRERVCAELRDIREHGVDNLFTYLRIHYERRGERIVPSYAEIDEGFALLRRFGFAGTMVVNTGFLELARLLGHADVTGRGATGASLDGDERFASLAARAIRGLDPLKKKYPEFRVVVTHMDEVLGRRRLPLYIRLTKPIRRAPEQLVYITLHTMPRPWVPEATRRLDPYVDIRCYNGHALDLWIRAGHTFAELKAELARAGDEGWVYYNPHRPFFTAKWARIVNSLFLWWSPLRVNCPYRYRTMRSYPWKFIWNMGFTVMSVEDFKTPIATRQWEGFRLGAQDVWYICMLEDLIARAKAKRLRQAAAAEAWLQHLRGLMPQAPEIQGIQNESPVVFETARRLDGAALEKLRLTTAQHIVALQAALQR